MAKIAYIEKRFSKKSQALISIANDIITEYSNDGMKLTLRQLYYQFVARDFIPNNQSEYNKLGSVINDARLAGLIDWNSIEDRTRNLQSNTHWTDPGEIIKVAASSFMLDRWKGQKHQVEVWIEKEALVGVIASICGKLDVPYFACRGYVSQSEMWSAAMRMKHYENIGRQPIILHLGDHDPSGIDMTRDIEDRQDLFDAGVLVNRLALNMDQVRKYNPPPNPAKLTDSRCAFYTIKFGNKSWELDALEPRMLQGLIKSNVENYRNEEVYRSTLKQEKSMRTVLDKISDSWQTLM